MNELLNAFGGSEWSAAIDPRAVVFIIAMAFGMGMLIGFVYMLTHDAISYSRTFVGALAMMPMLVALILMSMVGNIYVAFGMLGVFGVVRFRNVLKDTRDTGFLLWAIMEGLALGTMRYAIATIALVGVAIGFIILWYISFGLRNRYDAVLTVRLKGDIVTLLDSLKGLLKRHSKRMELASQRRSDNNGTEVTYRVLLRDPARFSELQAEMAAVEGFENVIVYMHEDEAEI